LIKRSFQVSKWSQKVALCPQIKTMFPYRLIRAVTFTTSLRSYKDVSVSRRLRDRAKGGAGSAQCLPRKPDGCDHPSKRRKSLSFLYSILNTPEFQFKPFLKMKTSLRVFDAQPYRVIFDEKELRISPNKPSEIIKVLRK
jgi:hypothetical protein